MRLLNVKTRKVESFDGDDVPEYAILSHRWWKEEVTIQNVEDNSGKQLIGYYKIDMCCKEAESHGIEYIWADTACIDKTSSAELSEAINSMYRWYENAVICFVYLWDVTDGDALSFDQSSWFTRGWTLQELLAPRQLLFFDCAWKILGTKYNQRSAIAKITGIPMAALSERFVPSSYLIAERMSWAATRQTKRREDRAYSLLGIFEVSMSMLYGEGDNAFFRLQEEIIKISADESVFAWNTDAHSRFGMFASSPASFVTHENYFVHEIFPQSGLKSNGYTLSNAGLSIDFILLPWAMDVYVGLLRDCSIISSSGSTAMTDDDSVFKGQRLGILLCRDFRQSEYRRISIAGQSLVMIRPDLGYRGNGIRAEARKLLISREILAKHSSGSTKGLQFQIESIDRVIWSLSSSSIRGMYRTAQNGDNIEMVGRDGILGTYSQGLKALLPIKFGEAGAAGMLRLTSQQDPVLYLWFVFDFDFNPIILIMRAKKHRGLSTEHLDIQAMSAKCSEVSTRDSRTVMDFIHMLSHKDQREITWPKNGVMILRPEPPVWGNPYACTVERISVSCQRVRHGYSVRIGHRDSQLDD